jgi:hypothetical protein
MHAPHPDIVTVPCHRTGCSKTVAVPAGKVRAKLNAGKDYLVFCSRLCNLKHVAIEGARQQELLIAEETKAARECEDETNDRRDSDSAAPGWAI